MKHQTLFAVGLWAALCIWSSCQSKTGSGGESSAAAVLPSAQTLTFQAPQAFKRPSEQSGEALYEAAQKFRKEHGSAYPNVYACLQVSDNKHYFFVTERPFEEPKTNAKGELEPAQPYKAGLIAEDGKVIIPVEMERIGNLGGTLDGCIEVKKNGKWGLYNLAGEVLVPAEMDAIYPYAGSAGDVLVQVRRGEHYGWLGKNGTLSFDPASHSDAALFKVPDINKAIQHWKISFDMERLHPYVDVRQEPEDGALGVLFAPGFLLQLGILPDAHYNWAVDAEFGSGALSAQISNVQRIDEQKQAVYSNFLESVMDARGYSYTNPQLSIVDNNLQVRDKLTVHSSQLLCNDQTEYRFLSSSLLEVRYGRGYLTEYDKYSDMPGYKYYSISPEGKLTEQTTHRFFAFTKYVKIDEAYFKGCFSRPIEEGMDKGYNEEEHNFVQLEHLDIEDLDRMRNEIFAEYGYKFTTDKWKKYFSKQPWYKPQFDNVDDKLSDIDKANIAFILQYKAKMEKNEANYTKKTYTMYIAAG